MESGATQADKTILPAGRIQLVDFASAEHCLAGTSHALWQHVKSQAPPQLQAHLVAGREVLPFAEDAGRRSMSASCLIEAVAEIDDTRLCKNRRMLRRLLQKWLVRLVAGSWTVDTTKIRPAFVDQLTGLSTRYVLIDRLRVASGDATPGSVAVIDIDHFKLFNDRFGHQIGDGLIEVVAKRLDAVVPNGACLSRLGGDEFAVFVPNVDVMAAKALLEHFLERLRQPVALPDGSSHVVTASVGVAAFAGQSIDDTLRASDVALYAAKARGRDRVVVFDDDTREVLTARRELAAAVIDLQERNRALRDEARTDALTGLRNRMALNEVLDVVVGSSDSPWSRAGIAFIDIDHFGAYNHLHGDSAGDEALRRVAAAIRAVSRESDIVFRKGGEEIVVLLVDVVRETAAMAAERLRAAVFELAIPHTGSTTAPIMSVTVGVATGEPGCCIRDLMESASDQAMSAKVRGARNHVFPVHLEVGWRNNLSRQAP